MSKHPYITFAEQHLQDGEELFLTVKGNLAALHSLVLPVEQRGQGRGSEILELLTEEADAQGLLLACTPSTDFGASSVARLKRLYARFGFVENKGRNKCWETRESMVRHAQG